MIALNTLCRCGHEQLAHADKYDRSKTERVGFSVGKCLTTLTLGERSDGKSNNMSHCACTRFRKRGK